jgi:NADH-quinone oxidoreductase subunit A
VTGIWYVVGFVIAGTLFVFGTIGLAWLISHRTRGDEHKGYPYESGIDTYGDTHARYGISFYIYALMFVAFDIEVIFIFLWALIFQSTPSAEIIGLFATMLIFVGILLFGLAYAWRKGVLTWR